MRDHIRIGLKSMALEAKVVACITLACFFSACGGGAGATLNLGDSTTLRLTLSPTSIDFGKVALGSTNTQEITIANSGNADLSVTQATLTGTGFSVSGLTPPLTLSAGQSVAFSVSFSPTGAGSFTGSISVVSNAPDSPATVALSGTGVSALLTPNPTSLSFGNVTVGSGSTLPVVLKATGTDSVTISQANVTGTGFSITGLTTPLTLTGGQSTSFSVRFAPTSSGSVTGSVTVVSNAANSPTSVSLSGTGTAVSSHSVALSWTASTSTNVVGYNVYRGSTSGAYNTTLNSQLVSGTTYTDATVQAGQTYYYVATAVDSNNQESAYSNEAQAAVPTP